MGRAAILIWQVLVGCIGAWTLGRWLSFEYLRIFKGENEAIKAQMRRHILAMSKLLQRWVELHPEARAETVKVEDVIG